jgi:hypothetical protein
MSGELTMQLKEIGVWKLVDPEDIIKEFGLEEALKKKYGVPTNNFNFGDIGETVIVEELLDNIPNRLFHCTFVEIADSEGYYHIVEFELPAVQEELKNSETEDHLQIEDLFPYDGKVLDIKDQQFAMACHHNGRVNTIMWKNKDYFIYVTPYDYGTAGVNFEFFLQSNGAFADEKRYKNNVTTPEEYFIIVVEYISKFLDDRK